MDWIHLPHDMGSGRALVNTATKLQVSWRLETCGLDEWPSASFYSFPWCLMLVRFYKNNFPWTLIAFPSISVSFQPVSYIFIVLLYVFYFTLTLLYSSYTSYQETDKCVIHIEERWIWGRGTERREEMWKCLRKIMSIRIAVRFLRRNAPWNWLQHFYEPSRKTMTWTGEDGRSPGWVLTVLPYTNQEHFVGCMYNIRSVTGWLWTKIWEGCMYNIRNVAGWLWAMNWEGCMYNIRSVAGWLWTMNWERSV
jgi:hypothetical protein